MAAPPRPTDPAVMIDELVEEFLLRLPPEDPAHLARAALVSRQWYRVVTGPSFRRRLRELYRSTPPLLGYFLSYAVSISFMPLSSFRPPRTHRLGVRAVSSSHGRVLLRRSAGKESAILLSVWDPVTDEEQDLPMVPWWQDKTSWDAAIICVAGDDCDHLHCHFKVVFVGHREGRDFSCFYSSEAGTWSDPVIAAVNSKSFIAQGTFILIGTALYTICLNANEFREIIKYDLRAHQLCRISITIGAGVPHDILKHSFRLFAAEDGKLGFATATNSTLGLWIWENGRLEESRAIDLHTLLPADALHDPNEAIQAAPFVVTFAATGAGVIFLVTRVGYFTIDLKSGSSKKVGEISLSHIVPFVSFYTPAPGAVSTDDRPGAGVAITTDEVPVAVSVDDGPVAGAAVTANKGWHVSSA